MSSEAEVDFLDTPEVAEILGFMIFGTVRIAHFYREHGEKIAEKAETEHSFVLLKMLKLARIHGAGWRVALKKEMELLLQRVKLEQLAEELKKYEAPL